MGMDPAQGTFMLIHRCTGVDVGLVLSLAEVYSLGYPLTTNQRVILLIWTLLERSIQTERCPEHTQLLLSMDQSSKVRGRSNFLNRGVFVISQMDCNYTHLLS